MASYLLCAHFNPVVPCHCSQEMCISALVSCSRSRQYIIYYNEDEVAGFPKTARPSLLLPILCRAASSAALSHTGGFRVGGVESTTVTHSSADWWDLLLPLA